MTKARDLANIISGGFTESDIPALATAKITSGTFVDARLPSTALNSNVDLTTLSASNLTSGTVATARLGSGTASSSTFLRGDGSFATPVGGANTPYFMAQHANNTTTANDNSETAVPFAVEKVDTDSAFASNAFTVPTGKGGNYFISAQVIVGCPSSGVFLKTATVNVFVGSAIKLSANVRIGDLATALNPSCNGILPLAEGDVVTVKASGDTNDSSTVRFEGDSAGGSSSTYFSGFKLI